ncbi:MAG: hydantoinase B/oxoprolinase family protein [Dehalococcoidia bacterium]|nr:hydantoinase B/oxoprolinase family protein [Dehalococcoidia bacterium]
MTALTATRTDPITTEIIRNAFLSCAQDMNATLIRSSYTPIIYEGKDCAVALLDERADVLAQAVGVTMFLGNLEASVKLTAEQIGWDGFRPGDVFYTNSPSAAGTHLNDATIFAPIFWRNRLVGFSATRAHWLDVGAKDPGGSMDATELYQEGMRWGPTRLYEDARPREDLIDLLRDNGRFGLSLVGDMNAQVAACRTGEARFRKILDRFGEDAYVAARDDIYRQSEQLEREAVEAIPNGVYRSEGCLDDDGLGNGPLLIRMRIDVEGDSMRIDLNGSASQTRGPVNSYLMNTISACRVGFKMLIHPDRPVDGGTFRTLEVTAPEGSICAPQEPAPCQFSCSPGGLLVDLVIHALASVLPEAAAAAHYGDSMILRMTGDDPRRGERFLLTGPHAGGWGAWAVGDGADALINVGNGAFKDYPIEVVEQKYPVIVRGYGIRCDTGGAGRFRGGCGVYRRTELAADARVSAWFERFVTPAWGVFGGADGAGPEVVTNEGRADERRFRKINILALSAGDVVELRTGGGGGYGQPTERDPERVREDVLDGYVSRAAAMHEYGVVLRADLTVDLAATLAAREAARRAESGDGPGEATR